jgi:hypothetical protein
MSYIHAQNTELIYIYSFHKITHFYGGMYLNFVTFWKCLLDIIMHWF